MDPTTFAIGASVVLALSFAIYQIGKPTPLPLIPHNKLEWFTGDIPFLARQAKEKGSLTFAFDDTARRLGPVSQVCLKACLPPASWLILAYRLSLDSAHPGPVDNLDLGRQLLFSQYVLITELLQ
jgi:hypothetical protein